MFSLITVYLVLVIVLPLALSAVVSCRTLPEGRRCSQCGGETMRLRSRWLRLATTCFRDIELHSRWCPACGWTGVARVPREVPPFGSISLIRAHATRTVALGETAHIIDRFEERIHDGFLYGDYQFATDSSRDSFLARGIFSSKNDLKRKIMRYIRHYNRHAAPFKWTYRNAATRIR